MQKSILISFIVGILAISGVSRAEDPVYFADSNLKATVEAELGITNPTPTDMLGLTYLLASYDGIFDLTGLEYATNLIYLNGDHV